MSFVIVSIILFSVLLISSVIFILYRGLHKEDENYRDDTLVENYITEFTNGFARGSLIDIKRGPNGRMGIIFLPHDVDYMRKTVKGEKLEIKPVIIFAPISNIIPLPRGTLSSDRNIIQIYPENSEDLPIEYRNSKWGKALMRNVAEVKAETTVVAIQRRQIEIEDMLLNRTHGKNRFLETLKMDDANFKDALHKLTDKSDTKKFSPNIPYSQQQQNNGGY